ncbi:helix-turn-helix domain-containing protein [Rhodoblastus sp.]|jgi:DNA-binding MarR family transcriptional regulator|uniref:MarR family winged helix-turn-helix transcriptional regulator n=1 Tax=Rhodoblastus sp. TaxID=1962975 RepID=UPI0025FF7243|nr:helix-turn-helix domain-containing protein [Rhodoblastus sp.]
MSRRSAPLHDSDYAALADFRAALRGFTAFSETKAAEVGLTPRQHQALLAIRGKAPGQATIGYVAERLILKPHSASELVDRLDAMGLIIRQTAAGDRRKTILVLTNQANALLAALSASHREEIRRLKPLLLDLLNRFG